MVVQQWNYVAIPKHPEHVETPSNRNNNITSVKTIAEKPMPLIC